MPTASSSEKVRVARALQALPLVSSAMKRGELSYAKVRAITRVATPENEARLVDVARCGTAAHVERLVRAWRRVDRIEAARETARRHASRALATWVDDDGMLILRGRLAPEQGSVVQQALAAASDRLWRETAGAPVVAADAGITPAQRWADALVLLAEAALAAGLDRGTAGDRYQVVLHVDAETLADQQPGPRPDLCPSPESRPDPDPDPDRVGPEVFDPRDALVAACVRPSAPGAAGGGASDQSGRVGDFGVLRSSGDGGQAVLEDSGVYVSAETARRLACDASVVVRRHAGDGAVLDAGRKARTIPPAIRRALAARDRQCRFPGCTARYCDAHHVQHWADGGPTTLENLLLLCRRHHRAVHEEGWTIVRSGADTAFVPPVGCSVTTSPPPLDLNLALEPPLSPANARLRDEGVVIGPHTATPQWKGEPLDVAWAIDVLRSTAPVVCATDGC